MQLLVKIWKIFIQRISRSVTTNCLQFLIFFTTRNFFSTHLLRNRVRMELLRARRKISRTAQISLSVSSRNVRVNRIFPTATIASSPIESRIPAIALGSSQAWISSFLFRQEDTQHVRGGIRPDIQRIRTHEDGVVTFARISGSYEFFSSADRRNDPCCTVQSFEPSSSDP